MVPTTFTFLDSLPVNANGKVNRRALPDPTPGGAGSDGVDDTPPRTETEAQLLELWTDLLRLDRDCGVHADFFRLGGYSLLAPKLVWAVAERLHVALPVRVLYEAPTVAELAERVDAARLIGVVASADETVESFEF
jgi:hypothetical protein